MSDITAQPVFETTASALQEKSKLRRHFRRFDMFFYLICTIVTLDTVGAVPGNGAQGFTWLIFLGIFFFLPYVLSIAELGSAFPQEGGPYVWTRLAFRCPLAAINSVIYWISNPIWIGGSLTIVSFAAIEEFFGPVAGAWKYAYAAAFIWFTIGTAIISLRYGKWVPSESTQWVSTRAPIPHSASTDCSSGTIASTWKNLCGLGEMPSSGGWILVGGLRIRAGSGSPATVFGLIP